MVKACIFDLDGTLLNTIYALSYCISLTMREFGGKDIDEAHTKLFVGDGYKELVKRALIYSGDTRLVHMEAACMRYLDIFNKNSLYNVQPYDGIIDAIKFLNKKSIKTAVLSNKPEEIIELGIKKDDILYFGDTSTDMLTASNSGVKAVGVLWGFRDRKELEAYKPHKIIENPVEIMKLV